ncbi:MAG: TonB-dependent hemoglobin/transferrin/lactoferrin family receptor [Acidobacteriota bacterium]
MYRFPAAKHSADLGRLFALLLAVLMLAIPAFAQEAKDDEDDSQTFSEEVTVTATLSERAVSDTPGHVSVVTDEEIDRLGFRDIEDLITFEPGVTVDNDPTRLGLSGFRIRGIGGNRVMTRVDGVATSEQFNFGPFNITQFATDVDLLETVEIVRSAGSALYGSDALGGVVSLITKSPSSYLQGERFAARLRGGYDGRDESINTSGVLAYGEGRWETSLYYGRTDGEAIDNQGDIGTRDSTRTEPNPSDRTTDNALFKLVYTPNDNSRFTGSFEYFSGEANTEVFTSQTATTLDVDAEDTQERFRFSLDHSLLLNASVVDDLQWKIYAQQTDTEQQVDERRIGFAGEFLRDGFLGFEQDTFGAELTFNKNAEWGNSVHRFTWGASYLSDEFSQFRDRTDTSVVTGQPLPSFLFFPTKYFPDSEVVEFGAFLQDQIEFGRVILIPGVRFDSYELDADENDQVFLDGNPGTGEPVDLDTDAVSPKLGVVVDLSRGFSLAAQYARGFRAPPMSDVNNGFTNFNGGYRTLPNPDLEPETSDNLELSLRGNFARGNFSVTVFENTYEDFIQLVTLGFSPVSFLLEFQPQNVDNVTISGFELDGRLRLGQNWQLRGAFAVVDAENDDTGEPLTNIEPSRLVLGAQYFAPSGRWGAALTGTAVAEKDEDDLPDGSNQFQAPSYEVIDLAAWISLTQSLELQVTVSNLTDETYYPWPNIFGQQEGSTTIDRFSAPGTTFGAQLRFRF